MLAMLDYLFRTPPDLAGFVLLALAFIVALSLHEYGHALSATLQGDPTAKLAGRLTVNPKSHLDMFGTLMLVLVGFGWGKPVPFAPNRLRYRRWGAALVAVAGPLVNVFLALLSAWLLVNLFRRGMAAGLTGRFLEISVFLNVTLAIFNLLPIPPLDGSRILGALLPPEKQHIVYFLDRWGFVILLLTVFFFFRPLVGPIIASGVRLVFLLVGA